MNKIDNATEQKWVLCHDSKEIFHVVKLEIGNNLGSGQPFLEQFDTEEELEQRVNTLTNNSNYYSENLKKKNNKTE